MVTRAIRCAGTQAAGFFAVLFALAVTNLSIAGTTSSFDSYRLTDAALDGYEHATETLYRYTVNHPEMMAAADESDDGDSNIDVRRMAARIDARAPKLRDAMEKSGLSLEEYFTFTVVMAANAFGVAMADQFGMADDSKLSDVQRANMAFVRKHQQRFEQFGERMAVKYGPLTNNVDEETYDDGEEDQAKEK